MDLPIRIVYCDSHLVVVDKPPGLTTVRHKHEAAEFGERAQRFLPPTLADKLPPLLPSPPRRVFAVHRLDRDTSGLVMFARTKSIERILGRMLRERKVHRIYVALVRGSPSPGRIESYLVRDRGDGRRGSTAQSGRGRRAVTHVRVIEPLGEFAFVECRLETGRTHQIRIHLGEAGTPLCGEHIYDRPLRGKPIPDHSGADRPMLHAARLEIVHPVTGQFMRWSAPLPADMSELLQRLRERAK